MVISHVSLVAFLKKKIILRELRCKVNYYLINHVKFITFYATLPLIFL